MLVLIQGYHLHWTKSAIGLFASPPTPLSHAVTPTGIIQLSHRSSLTGYLSPSPPDIFGRRGVKKLEKERGE
jgi:hypothetical protein